MSMAALKTEVPLDNNDRVLLLGCGILKKEIHLLIERNGWPLDTLFLDSILHVDFTALATSLKTNMARHAARRTVVFYGACHPQMEQMLEEAGNFRTAGQNCVEMLLGHDRFNEELANGAYFLLEEWAQRWEYMITKTFGTNKRIIRDIFQGDRNSILCLKTPCSRNFKAEAEAAGRLVGLPLRWADVPLDHLETVLQNALSLNGELHV
ncbi:MAG: DUF1638 domain-containing protein [Desulfuromonadaceae bacterium]|nr:DUF1638 domain-containing protein [Desulfuromonadaceae bacterium]MDD2856088.1 DUF1638 domain-containing protein [Desulfuromonadaceae bacterium]